MSVEESSTEVSVSHSADSLMGTKLGEISLTVVEARNLPSKVYHCVVRLRNSSDRENMKTTAAPKTSAPRWNQTFKFPITEIDNDVRVMLYGKKKTYSLGEVIVPLSVYKNLETTKTEKWFSIIKTMSDININGEIFLTVEYRPAGETGGDKLKEKKVSLLRSLQSGPTTAFEKMENAVLEEHGFLTSELKRVARLEGKESTSRTVNNMLVALEKTADELKLKRWMDIQVEDISYCLSQIRKFSKSLSSVNVKSMAEIEDDLVVVSSEMSSIISNLQSKQASIQQDSFILLDDRLTTDSEKRSFTHGGGISALLQLLTSSDEDIVEKALEILQMATYFESGRAHRELYPVSVAETVSGFAESSNKNHQIYASCIVTNLLHIKDSTLYNYFTEGNGRQDIQSFLGSDNSFLQLRTLWGLSAMPAGDKSQILEHIWDKIIGFMGDSKRPEHQAKATAIIANFAYDAPNLTFITSKSSEILPLLKKLLTYADERSIEALRALANLSNSKEMRKAICGTDCVDAIVQLLSTPLMQVQACWTIGNICMDDRSVLAVRNSGALERMLDLMADSKTSFDINEKILWAISNSLIDDQTKEIIISQKNGLSSLVKLLQCGSEKLISLVLDIVSSLSNRNFKVSSLLGDLNIMQILAELLTNCRQPHVKDKICWTITRLTAGNTVNQDSFRKAGGIQEIGELIESGEHLQPASWALFNLIVENEQNLEITKQMDLIQPLVQGLQDEKAGDISRKLLAIFASNEEQKRKIIDVVVRDVRTRKISYLLN